ncbi:MAG: hypothetical protein ACP5N1_03310 [Candidatus Woesearchaeota archaeon]
MTHFTFNIDNRRIRIIYKNISSKYIEQNKKKLEILNNIIIKNCEECAIAKYFASLNFVICGTLQSNFITKLFFNNYFYSDNKIGLVRYDSSELILGIGVIKSYNTVYINSKIIDYTEIEKTINDTIKHELTHLWHIQISKFSAIIPSYFRLDNALKIPENSLNLIDITLKMRMLIFKMLEMIIKEGIARFGQIFFSNDNHSYFTQKEWINKYTCAIVALKKINYALNNYYSILDNHIAIEDKESKLKSQIFKYSEIGPFSLSNDHWYITNIHSKQKKESIEDTTTAFRLLINTINQSTDPYDIGDHIIYTILYDNKEISFEELIRMSYIHIIKKYETCMIQRNQQPVISYSSGRGMIDYADLLKKAVKYYEIVKNKKK